MIDVIFVLSPRDICIKTSTLFIPTSFVLISILAVLYPALEYNNSIFSISLTRFDFINDLFSLVFIVSLICFL